MRPQLIVAVLLVATAKAYGGCADFGDLEGAVLKSLMRFAPGTPLADVVALENVSMFDHAVRDDMKQVWFSVYQKDATRSVGTSVRCDMTLQDRLADCEAFPLGRTRYIAQKQFDSLRLGQSVPSVLEDLCQPGRFELRNHGVFLQYLIRMKERVGGQFDAMFVDLTFDGHGRLRRKDAYFK